jgi:hypothetical protein
MDPCNRRTTGVTLESPPVLTHRREANRCWQTLFGDHRILKAGARSGDRIYSAALAIIVRQVRSQSQFTAIVVVLDSWSFGAQPIAERSP